MLRHVQAVGRKLTPVTAPRFFQAVLIIRPGMQSVSQHGEVLQCIWVSLVIQAAISTGALIYIAIPAGFALNSINQMKNNISPRAIALTFGVLVVCFAAGFYIFAWTGPTAAPPNNNTSVPINTGTENQTKQGGLKISGTLEAAGFKIPTSAGLGKILTSDVSGAGTWQTPPLGESVLVNYGGCDEQGGVCNPASCPAGWTESGSGTWTTHAFYGPWNDFHIYRVAARTCFKCF